MWSILADPHTTASGHAVMVWEVGVDRQEEVDHERVVRWNLAAMTGKETEAVEKLWKDLAKKRVQLDTECREDKVEQEATWCQEERSSGLDTMATMIRFCARSQRQWNAEIKERRKLVGRERRRRWNSEEDARVKAELQHSIRQSKSKMLSDHLQSLRGAERWRVARYTNPRPGMNIEAMTDRHGKQAITSLEEEKELRQESIPPNDGDQYCVLLPAGRAHTGVTE